MAVDMLRQPDQWKLKWRAMKEKMAVVKNRYVEKDHRAWVMHWDHQMYKVKRRKKVGSD